MTKCDYIENGKRCRKTASQGYDGKPPRQRCAPHKLEGMKNVTYQQPLCQYKDEKIKQCLTGASYNYPKMKKRIYCEEHCKEGMINLKNIRCKCGRIPTFNFEGSPPRFCKACKEEGMINTRNNMCIVCRKSQAVCDYDTIFTFDDGVKTWEEGYRPQYCEKCKLKGMVNLAVRKCVCGKGHRIYNYRHLSPNYCKFCRKDGMINTKDRRCNNDFCDTLANKKYDYYCCHCFTNLFPLDPRTAKAGKKSKEIAVKNYLGTYTTKKGNKPHSNFIHDRAIYSTSDCQTKRRIDLYRYIGNNHILCIEVDEKQHKWYDKQDEENRYNELYEPGYCMIYIRYNPDTYRDKKNKIQDPSFEYRMKILINTIEKIEKNIKKNSYDINDKLVHIEYLFYDKYSPQNK